MKKFEYNWIRQRKKGNKLNAIIGRGNSNNFHRLVSSFGTVITSVSLGYPQKERVEKINGMN